LPDSSLRKREDIRIFGRSTFITDTHLDDEILIHMPRIHTLISHIGSENVIVDPAIRLSTDDI
jgi:hypothetical protein